MLSISDYVTFNLSAGETIKYTALDGTTYSITPSMATVPPTKDDSSFPKTEFIQESQTGSTEQYELICRGQVYCKITAVILEGVSQVKSKNDESSHTHQISHDLTKIGSVKYFVQKYGVYPPKKHMKYKFEKFVLSTLHPNYNNEASKPDNTATKKDECILSIHEGRLHKKDNSIFTTECEKKASNDNGEYIWVLDKKGHLFSTTMYGEKSGAAIGNHHSFFLKSKPCKEYYGLGKPVACGGHIKVNQEGKIIYLDNSSGHYKPNYDQFVLAIKHLNDLDVFVQDCKVSWQDEVSLTRHEASIQDIDITGTDKILASYDELS